MTIQSSKGQNLAAKQISIQSWDIITSSLEKQTSAILEFSFRLRFRPHLSNRYVILQRTIKFHPNRSIRGRYMTSYRFLKMAAAAAQYYFRFLLVGVTFSQGQNVSSYQISSTCHNSRLRYNYYSFLNTNICHIGILLLVSFRLYHCKRHVILPNLNFIHIGVSEWVSRPFHRRQTK